MKGSSKIVRGAAAAGALLALFSIGATVGMVSLAGASLTETTTSPEPTPTTSVPAPDPAPAPKPAAKPVLKPARAPVVHYSAPATRSAPVTHTSKQAYTPRTTPTYTPPAAHSAPVHHKSKEPKRHMPHHPATKRASPVTGTVGQTLAESVVRVAPVAAVTRSRGKPVRPLILALFCASLLLLAVGATPARHVPWRRGAWVLQERQLEVTLFGVGFLVITAFTLLLWGR